MTITYEVNSTANGDTIVKTKPEAIFNVEEPINPIPWPDPLPEDLKKPEFEAIWQTIKTWDINVPEAYCGYCGASGNHVKAILDALK